ncbi:MAG: PBSX family phage terminase large subunit, partial [Clostridia bacterium]|nr:PBSX family phage terminase large subunit [Clostridia bacterium]
HEIIADAAEPKSIAELRAYGLNVVPAQKGPDSIKIGIDTLKKYKVYVTRRSANIRTERGKYRWKTGNDGEPTNTPVELFNHAMDAIRYVGLNKLVKKAERGKTTYTY